MNGFNLPPDGITKTGRWRYAFYFAALFTLALIPRLYGAHTVGWGWDSPDSFTVINFDEAGSCRAALGGFSYSTFIGRQTVAIAGLLGTPVGDDVIGNAGAVKSYCHSPEHISVARSYSAVAGALTVVLIGIIALLLVPAHPGVAWTTSVLLALSGFHISESQSGTVDAPSVLYIYLFLTVTMLAVKRRNSALAIVSPVFMLAAIWTKYWVFAVFAYVAVVSTRLWLYLSQGMSTMRIGVLAMAAVVMFALLTNAAFPRDTWYPVLGLYWLLVPWMKIRRLMVPVFLLLPPAVWFLSQVEVVSAFTMGGMESNFGSGYAAIGCNKWLRNLVNVPVIVIVGLGIPAALFVPVGIRAAVRAGGSDRAWLCLAPVAVFALYMLFLAPVTYYRHYLVLIPVAALLASYGLWTSTFAHRRWFKPLFLPLFVLWPAMLALDMGQDYQNDPRIELRQWYGQHPDDLVFASYYVSPPRADMSHTVLFKPEYAFGEMRNLKQGDYLILSENWYDTSFANELNGPVVGNTARLIKTKPEYVAFYRKVLANEHPNLELERAIDVQNFMPELVLHKWLYGTFQMFVGDIKIYRVVH